LKRKARNLLSALRGYLLCVSSCNPPILHRKEAFLDELHPDYQACLNLTEKEEELGLLSRNDIGTRNGWATALAERRATIEGYNIEEQ
jgi:hypothetical protein